MAAIKPEIYISWIPRGQISIKPEIYASMVIAPHIEQISADTKREVRNLETISADTSRRIGTTSHLQADTCRIVQKSEIVQADTFRQICVKNFSKADTFRFIQAENFIKADTRRKISNIEVIKADTSRDITDSTLPSEIIADTLLRNGCREKIFADTSRKIIFSNLISGDTLLKIKFNETNFADTFLKNACRENISADTKIATNYVEKISADTLRKVQAGIEKISADTLLQLREIIQVDTLRQIVKVEKIFADTTIRIPHILKYTINSPLVNTFKDYGLTSLSITLQEKTLSDTYRLETVRPMEINDEVKGMLLDYPISFLVEETNQQDLIQSVKGMYDQDKILYSRMFLAEEVLLIVKNHGGLLFANREVDYTATTYLETIAQYLGLETDIKFEDFVTYNITADQNTTYANLLSSVFGWTSRLPQRQINVFIRAGTLHGIQRGMEESVLDISDFPHSRPAVNKKLLRTMWNKGKSDNDDDDDQDNDDEYSELDISEPFSGTVEYSESLGGTNVTAKLTYKTGYLVSEFTRSESTEYTAQSQSLYTYSTMGIGRKNTIDADTFFANTGTYYLVEKSSYNMRMKNGSITGAWGKAGGVQGKGYNGSSGSFQTTQYTYKKTASDDVYLCLEVEESQSGEEKTYRETHHTPIGNGWYAQTVYVDGEPMGSNLSQGAPGNAVKPYTVNEVQKTFTKARITPEKKDKDKDKNLEDEYKKLRQRVSPLADVSFPVRDIATLFELTKALEWLDRKTQEEISVDITDKVIDGVPEHLHIIDFTERILLDGNEYFLVSNNIQFTPRKLIQKLRLVRWY